MTNISAIEALSDPTRRKLFEQLRGGPCSVSRLVAAVTVSQPAVSQHLRVLSEARLVRMHKQGTRRIYSLNPEGLTELRAYVDSLWEDALGAFKKAADEAAQQEVQDE
jgi:DNA-binding transcriptional ArsR family regulator